MSNTEYTLTFEERGSYLYAYLKGMDSFAASLSYWNEIADKARELDATRVLVHENLLGDLSEGEIFDIMIDILPAGVGIRVAFFDENHSDTPINELGQLIANNRGADIRIFHSLEAAEKWIAQND